MNSFISFAWIEDVTKFINNTFLCISSYMTTTKRMAAGDSFWSGSYKFFIVSFRIIICKNSCKIWMWWVIFILVKSLINILVNGIINKQFLLSIFLSLHSQRRLEKSTQFNLSNCLFPSGCRNDHVIGTSLIFISINILSCLFIYKRRLDQCPYSFKRKSYQSYEVCKEFMFACSQNFKY